MLSGIEINLFLDGTGAYRAEFVAGEGVHQAIGTGTIYSFLHVSATLVNTEFFDVAAVDGCGDRGVFLQHIFPFLVEIDEGCQVGFPGFNSFGIHIVVRTTDFHVFITQSGKKVSELVDVNFGGVQVAVDADPVVVVDSASAVFLGIGDDVNEVVRNVAGKVTKAFVIVSHDVTFRIKRVE